MYPLEYPLWSLLARFGRQLTVKIEVQHDEEAGVYIATSRNLNGLICEAETMAELKAETERVLRDMVAFCVRGRHPGLPVLEWPA